MSKRLPFALAVLSLCLGLGADRAFADGRVAIYPQLGHHFTITAVSFSPDGKTLASGSIDWTIKLWDVASGREIRTLDNNDAVFAVAFSPDGKTLASSGEGGDVTLWNVRTGEVAKTLAGTSSGVEVVSFSPNGQVLASGEWGGDVRLWDPASGRARGVLRGHQGPVLALAFSPDGRTIASAGADKTIRLWDTASGRCLRTLTGHKGAITSIAFISGGAELVSFGADATIRYWDVRTGHLVRGFGGDLSMVTFAPDGKLAAIRFADNNVALYDVMGARFVRGFTRNDAAGDFQSETNYSFAFSRNGLLASGSKEGFHIAVWKLADGHEARVFGGHAIPVYSMALSPDGRVIASTNVWDCSAILWDRSTGHELRTVGDETESASAIAFAPSGGVLASGQRDKSIMFWDVNNGRALYRLAGRNALVRALAFSPDGTLLVSAAEDNTVTIWDIGRGQSQRVLSGQNVVAIAFSPDGKRLALASADKTIQIVDPSSGHVVQTLNGLAYPARWLAYAPDGTLASIGGDDSVKLWSPVGGRPRAFFTHGSALWAVAFSPDGKTLGVGGIDHMIELFDVASGREVRVLHGHSGFVSALAFAGDGKTLVSGSWDGTIREWSLPEGRERGALIADSDASSAALPGARITDALKDELRHSYIVVTPEGFFDSSSARVEDDLNVRVGDRVFGISSFRDNFYRPDLVAKALAGEDVTHFGSIDRVKLSPEVEFAGLPATASSPNLKMTLHLTNSGGGFGPVRVFWNGTIIQQDTGLPASGDAVTRSYDVPLQGGDNNLRATAFNADGTMWSDVRASTTLPLPKKMASAHGALHALVIGIQDFPRAPSHRLAYPAADASLIAATLSHKAAPLFAQVDVHLLTTPAQTDKVHIVQALKAMQAAAAQGDEFVLYVASHGIVFGDRYYVATSDIDPTQPAALAQHALSARELSDLLANIRASKKLVILDTCDSGAARDTLAAANNKAATNRAATILSRDFGFTVLAATTSNQDALEGGYNGHGLFTYVVNNGLSGKAADATGVVSSFLLADYVNDNVPTFAKAVLNRTQQPTAEKSGQPFAVTKVR